MQKNWHIIYSKPGNEKKVATTLAKKKIEHFLPMCSKIKTNTSFNRVTTEPLFPGYIFIYVTSDELTVAEQLPAVLSTIFWKDKPVILPAEDIRAIRKFTASEGKVELIPIKVDMQKKNMVIQQPPLIVSETFLVDKSMIRELSVPSVGYILRAEADHAIETERIISNAQVDKILN